jgi:hypothetical protein
MARVGTTNLGLGCWIDGENPGAGSQSIDSTGLNGNWIKLDTAVGVAHNPDGSHKTNIIDKANCKTTIADGSSIELHATNGLQIKALGVTAAKMAANSIAVGGVAVQAKAIKAADLADGCIDVGGLKIAAGAIKAADLGASAVETAAIKDANVTTAKLEYKELIGLLNQAGSGAPTLAIIKNTLGEVPVMTRYDVGVYRLTVSASLFLSGKVAPMLAANYAGFIYIARTSDTVLNIQTKNTSNAVADSILGIDTLIMVRVYP